MPRDGIYVGFERALEAKTPWVHENFDKGIHSYVLRLFGGADITFDEKYQSVSIGVHEFIKRTLIAFDKTAVATLTVVHRINPFRAASRLSLILSQKSADFLTQFRNFFKKSAEVQEKPPRFVIQLTPGAMKPSPRISPASVMIINVSVSICLIIFVSWGTSFFFTAQTTMFFSLPV